MDQELKINNEVAVLGAGSPNQSHEGLVRGKVFSKSNPKE